MQELARAKVRRCRRVLLAHRPKQKIPTWDTRPDVTKVGLEPKVQDAGMWTNGGLHRKNTQ